MAENESGECKKLHSDELRKYLLKKMVDKRFRSLEICFNLFLRWFPDRIAKEEDVVKMLAWTLLYYRRYEPCADNLKSWLQTSTIQWRCGDELFRVSVDSPSDSSYLRFCMSNINTSHCAEISIQKENLKSNFKDCHEALYKIDCAVSQHAKDDVFSDSQKVETEDSLTL